VCPDARLECIEDPVERQLQPTPPRPVLQQRQPALHQQSSSSSIGAVNAALCTVTGTRPGDGDCALHAAAGIGHAQLGPEELAAANAAAGALRTALLLVKWQALPSACCCLAHDKGRCAQLSLKMLPSCVLWPFTLWRPVKTRTPQSDGEAGEGWGALALLVLMLRVRRVKNGQGLSG
jgi:hypothetical protein